MSQIACRSGVGVESVTFGPLSQFDAHRTVTHGYLGRCTVAHGLETRYEFRAPGLDVGCRLGHGLGIGGIGL